jgi:Holliday junction resolvase
VTESNIQREIIATLRQLGIFAMRINSGTVKVRGAWMQLAPEGTADILAMPRGKMPVWIEVKAAKGRQRAAQEEFERTAKDLGHGYFVVRGLDDLEPLLEGMR